MFEIESKGMSGLFDLFVVTSPWKFPSSAYEHDAHSVILLGPKKYNLGFLDMERLIKNIKLGV